MNQEYAVFFEQEEQGPWGASVLGLPGCLSSGPPLEAMTVRIREAIEGHIATLNGKYSGLTGRQRSCWGVLETSTLGSSHFGDDPRGGLDRSVEGLDSIRGGSFLGERPLTAHVLKHEA